MSDKQLQQADTAHGESTTWERDRDRLKTLRVVVVLVFWFSAGLQLALYYLQDGQVNFILLSVISGMMVLGVILKIKFQRHLRKRVPE